MREMNSSACDALAAGVRWDSPALLASLIVLGLIDLMVVGGNVLVITAVFVSSKLRGSVTNLFIASLAVADLLLGVAVLPFSAAWEVFDEVWLFGDAWCSVWLAVDVWMCTASILNLCAISLDRYVAVTRPVSYPSIMSSRRAKSLIAGVWVLSFLICFPPLVGWNDHRDNATLTTAPSSSAAAAASPEGHSFAGEVMLTSAEASTTPVSFEEEAEGEWEHRLRHGGKGREWWNTSWALQQRPQALTTTPPSDLVDCPWVCELTNDAGYVVYSALGSFYIPMLVMLFFYWRIYRAAVRTTKAINQGFRTTKGSKVLGVGFGGGSGSFGAGASGVSRFDEHRLTLRIHRGRGSVMHHGGASHHNNGAGALDGSGCSPPQSGSSPRRLVRSRTQDRIRMTASPCPGPEGGVEQRRGGSCRARGSTAAALASAASSAAGTALFSVHYAQGGSSPPGAGEGGTGRERKQASDVGSSSRRSSSARFEGSHQHLLRVSSTSSNSGGSAALQRSQSARQQRGSGGSGGEAELMVPLGRSGAPSPASSPTTYESMSVSSATGAVVAEGGGSPGSSFGGGTASGSSGKRRQQSQQQQRRGSGQQSQQQQQHVSRMGKRNIKAQVKRFRMETKAAKTLGIIVGGFIVCWLPFFTMYLVRAFCEDCIPPLVFSILFWLGYCNSAINPCIYALFSKDFRFAFKRIICKCFCTGRRGWNEGGGGAEAGGGSWGSFRRRSTRRQPAPGSGGAEGRSRGPWGARRKRARAPPAWLLATSWARRTSGGPNEGPASLGEEDSEERGPPNAPPHSNGNVEVIVTSDSR